MSDLVQALGGIASTATLRGRGLPRRALERAERAGDLVRVRAGWYAVYGCPPALVTAVHAGGRLSCVSALRLLGVWTLNDRLVHVRVGRGATARRSSGTRLHWTHDHLGTDRAIDPPMDALRTAISCLDLRHAVAVVDSCANTGLVDSLDLERMLLNTPRGRRVLGLHDPRAESGLETFARLGLRSLRVRVRSQVVIPGVGRVDLLIGDRLVIELDGAAWHGGVADFERDRDRDRRLAVRGYLVLRASFRQVMEQWTEVREQIVALVRRREHLWRARDPDRAAGTWSAATFENDPSRWPA